MTKIHKNERSFFFLTKIYIYTLINIIDTLYNYKKIWNREGNTKGI